MFKILGMSAFSLLVIFNASAQTVDEQPIEGKMTILQNAPDYSPHRLLLHQHGCLLNKAILSALYDAPPSVMESGKAALLANSNAISGLIAKSKGPRAARDFESLFNQHILIGSQYILAIKNNNVNAANQIAGQASQNGRMLAQLLSRLAPNIPLSAWNQMLDQHVNIEAEQTRAYFRGDKERAMQLRDQSLVQLNELAKMIGASLQAKPANSY